MAAGKSHLWLLSDLIRTISEIFQSLKFFLCVEGWQHGAHFMASLQRRLIANFFVLEPPVEVTISSSDPLALLTSAAGDYAKTGSEDQGVVKVYHLVKHLMLSNSD